MKRAGILGLAIVLTLGLGVSASQAAKTKKIATEAEVEGIRDADGGMITFVGDVHSLRSKCEKRRDVTVVYNGPEPDPHFVGTATTDKTGDWELTRAVSGLSEGNYAVEVRGVALERPDEGSALARDPGSGRRLRRLVVVAAATG
jgi:hypothetical protein